LSNASDDWIDADIAAMKLSYGEKAGLQIYRNYTRSFQQHAIQHFVQTLDLEPIDLDDFRRLTKIICSEEPRFLPVVVCAFVDNVLEQVFRKALPDGIPGGKAKLFGSYAPLSDLAKRIQLAYAFDVLSPDLMEELDRLRSVRNRISHSWEISDLNEFLVKGRLAEMFRIEELLCNRSDLTDATKNLSSLAAFQIRLIWITGRLVYEAAAYTRAKNARLEPKAALYGKPPTKWLEQVSAIALEATKTVLGGNRSRGP
jgi:hypothetical protein